MVEITTTQFYIMCVATFTALVAMPVLSDYVFFVLDKESGWLRASVGAALIGTCSLCILAKLIGM
jgi:hypothetical protein